MLCGRIGLVGLRRGLAGARPHAAVPRQYFNSSMRMMCSVVDHEVVDKVEVEEEEEMSAANLMPRQVVTELDKHIVGQKDAKRAVAVALRNRWRRHKLPETMRDEVLPKNILMIGPTGVGKTEIVRRMSKLIDAPFIKVEATKFTEVGFHGRDVDQIIRDLLDFAIVQTKEKMRRKIQAEVKANADKKILDLLCGKGGNRSRFAELLKNGDLEDSLIQVTPRKPQQAKGGRVLVGGQAVDLSDMLSQMQNEFGRKKETEKTMPVKDARPILEDSESDNLMSEQDVIQNAIKAVEEDGVVFIDEIDKICSSKERAFGSGASDEGVQKDLLPLIEGSTISTKHGNVNTNHILFIASGAFHSCKPSDLLAELQGRLPVRVELAALAEKDLHRILTEPQHNLIAQQVALLATENLQVDFKPSAVKRIAQVAFEVNEEVENIGARRLVTIIEKVIEEVSFDAPELVQSEDKPNVVEIDDTYVNDRVNSLLKKSDLRKFVL